MSETNQAYISRVHLKGYKSIRDMAIDFKPGLNIIIGPNGSGKTNFLEFLDKIFRLQVDETKTQITGIIDFFRNNKKYTLDYSIVPNIESKNAQHVNISVLDFEGQPTYERKYLKIGNREIQNEYYTDTLFSNFDWYHFFSEFDKKGKFKLINFGVDKDFDTFFNGIFSLDFITEGVNSNQTKLNSLFKLIEHSEFNEDRTKLIQVFVQPMFLKILKNYSPIESLKFYIDNSRLSKGWTGTNEDDKQYFTVDNLEIQFLVSNEWMPWRMLSDGTKRIFFLIYEVFVSNSYIVCLEEPELGIHPDQLYKLMDFLKEQSIEKQIILTTHSPEVLNILSNDELDRIIVTHYDAEKGTQMRKMNEKQIEKAKRYMSKAGLFVSDYWVHSNLEEATYETEEN